MSDTSRYEEISDHFKSLIRSGELNPGDRLPTQRQVALDWAVAGATAAKAMTVLRDQGWTVTNRSAGTVVAKAHPAATGTIASLGDHAEWVATRQDGTKMEIVSEFTFANFVEAPGYVADALDVPSKSEVVKRVRTRRTEAGKPVLISESWCDGSVANAVPRLLLLEEVPGGIGAVEDALGVRADQLVERVSAGLAGTDQRNFYNLQEPSAITIKEHIWYSSGDPFYFGRAWLHPDEWSIYRVNI